MKFSCGISVKTVLFLFLTAMMSSICPAYGKDDLDASRDRLEQLQNQIQATLEGLQQKTSQGGELSHDLERLNVQIRRIERINNKSRKQLSETKKDLQEKQITLKKMEALRKEVEQQARKRLIVLYKSGDVGLIKALLVESESPMGIAEKYVFLARIIRFDRELLEEYRSQIQQHRSVLKELDNLKKKQEALVVQQNRERDVLKKAKKSKKHLLAEINQDKELLNKTLGELRSKVKRLNELVKKLESQELHPYTENLGGFQSQKGRLVWPVNGRIRVGFGQSRHADLGTLIESHGFDIEAAAGTPVNASAEGRVIFANSLRGYGKLMIIDHGNKYYTLYAHMDRFDKKVGETVSTAEVIAYSGYEGRDSVYFEIRQGGKPLDPGEWLKPQ